MQILLLETRTNSIFEDLFCASIDGSATEHSSSTNKKGWEMRPLTPSTICSNYLLIKFWLWLKLVNLKDEEKSYNSNSSILHILELRKDTQKSLGYVIRNFTISNLKISQVLAEINHHLAFP